jgi:hypothetical protein
LITVGAALLASPFITAALAANAPIIEHGMKVTQKVKSSAMLSLPIAGNFDTPASGLETGSVKWDVYTSSGQGYKLTVSASQDPALQADTCSFDDMPTTPAAWSVAPGMSAFGISATGAQALDSFDGGSYKNWRGLEGKRSIEVARYRGGAQATTRTTVWMNAENNRGDCADAKVHLTATAYSNLDQS